MKTSHKISLAASCILAVLTLLCLALSLYFFITFHDLVAQGDVGGAVGGIFIVLLFVIANIAGGILGLISALTAIPNLREESRRVRILSWCVLLLGGATTITAVTLFFFL